MVNKFQHIYQRVCRRGHKNGAQETGFTLVEAIVYTAIVAVLFVVVASTLLGVLAVYNTFDVYRDLQDSAVTSFERITREIRTANQISTSGSTFDSHPGTLVLSSTNESGDPITLEFTLDQGDLHIYKDGVDQGPLTSEDVSVSNLVFRHAQATSSELVKIEMALRSGEGDQEQTRSFNTSVVLRGSYDN